MSYDKPLPVLRGEEKLYFDHAREHELVYQRCGSCDHAIFYPRTVCPACSGTNLDTEHSTGRGRIHSHTTLHVPGHPAFADDVPYTVALIELDEGIRVVADVIEADPDDIHVGLPVEVTFDDVTDTFTLPRFRPTEGNASDQ